MSHSKKNSLGECKREFYWETSVSQEWNSETHLEKMKEKNVAVLSTYDKSSAGQMKIIDNLFDAVYFWQTTIVSKILSLLTFHSTIIGRKQSRPMCSYLPSAGPAGLLQTRLGSLDLQNPQLSLPISTVIRRFPGNVRVYVSFLFCHLFLLVFLTDRGWLALMVGRAEVFSRK